MGRGRSKAKQTKIARELKYADHGTDLARLQSELTAASSATDHDQAPGQGAEQYWDDSTRHATANG